MFRCREDPGKNGKSRNRIRPVPGERVPANGFPPVPVLLPDPSVYPGRKPRSISLPGNPVSGSHESLPETDPAGKSRVLFVPAFNELSGFDIPRIVKSPISPLSRCMNTASCEIFLPDGTYIGPLSSVEDNDARGNLTKESRNVSEKGVFPSSPRCRSRRSPGPFWREYPADRTDRDR